MKKFIDKSKDIMGKQFVMIILLVLALFFTALYIGVLARPVSYGMTYSMTIEDTDGTTVDVSTKFISDEIMEVTGFDGGTSVTMQMWCVINGNKVLPTNELVDETGTSGMTREEYEAEVESMKADPEIWNALWESDQVGTINAFSLDSAGEVLTCNGAIAFAVVMGVVTVVSIVMAGFSLKFYLAGRKTEGSQETTTEQE